MKIEIITTPNEKLKESGFGSITACKKILKKLKSMNYTSRVTICKNKMDLEKVAKRKPDFVILAVKYIMLKNEPNIWLSDFFNNHNIHYTGSSKEVLKFDSNKVLAKSYLKRKGIKTASYFTALPKEYKESELPFDFPFFLKPMDSANGNGIDTSSLVNTFKEYESKVLSLYNVYKEPVLVEEYLDGREFTVAIIKKENNELILCAIEIIPPKSENGIRILGAKVKKENSEVLKFIDNDNLKEKIEELASDVFFHLGVRDFGRIDIKTNKEEECFFLEANLVPGMTEGSSYFPKAFEISKNINYSSVVDLMIKKIIGRLSPLPNHYISNIPIQSKCINNEATHIYTLNIDSIGL